MDGLRRYARVRVQARSLALKKVFHFAKMYFAVLQYIFAMYFAFNWKQACQQQGNKAVNRETKCERHV
jgi:hypothetical protein